MIPTDRTDRPRIRPTAPVLTAIVAAALVGARPVGIPEGGGVDGPGVAAAREAGRQADDARVLLRLSADSGVVGHYRIQSSEIQRLAYDLPAEDPRAELLASATGPWQRSTDLAITMVTGEQRSDDVRRYVLYVLGYRLSGDEVRSLTPAQWDSIFQKVGRQAVLEVSPTGVVRGVQVAGDAVRPVGRALAGLLGGIALGLPTDSVGVGSSWQGRADVPVRRPDGTRTHGLVRMTYRLTAITEESGGRFARIEFDGAPEAVADSATGVSGRYFGEALFAIDAGRYEHVVSQAEIEVAWPAGESGLPASRSQVRWEATFRRVLGGSG